MCGLLEWKRDIQIIWEGICNRFGDERFEGIIKRFTKLRQEEIMEKYWDESEDMRIGLEDWCLSWGNHTFSLVLFESMSLFPKQWRWVDYRSNWLKVRRHEALTIHKVNQIIPELLSFLVMDHVMGLWTAKSSSIATLPLPWFLHLHAEPIVNMGRAQ